MKQLKYAFFVFAPNRSRTVYFTTEKSITWGSTHTISAAIWKMEHLNMSFEWRWAKKFTFVLRLCLSITVIMCIKEAFTIL